MAKKTIPLEQALTRLEEIVSRMERGDLTLEESLTLFQEGVEASRLCAERLNEAEARVHTLVRIEDGKFYLEPLTAIPASERDSTGDADSQADRAVGL